MLREMWSAVMAAESWSPASLEREAARATLKCAPSNSSAVDSIVKVAETVETST